MREEGEFPLWRHPEWRERFPPVIQGTTGGDDPRQGNFGLFGDTPVGEVLGRWRTLRSRMGMPTSVHARQVHGSRTATWTSGLPEGLVVVDGFDGHVSDRAGVLLTVSVADCVPVFLVSESRALVGLAHAGWRGVAGGIVEETIRTMAAGGADPERLWLHCGPSICGRCYEVGPEVHQQVNPAARAPSAPAPIDLPRAIAARAVGQGVRGDRITASEHCTRCGPGAFFSHRGGSPARQLGVLGLRG